MHAERFLNLTLTLGEGPVWDERTQTLYFVDIEGHALWAHDVKTGQSRETLFEERVGMCALTRDGGLAVALEKSLVLLKDDKHSPLVSGVEADLPDNRFNDGKCDPFGRLLVGSMDTRGKMGRGSLYSLEEGGALRKLECGVSISNGIGFSPDGRHMYYVDTPSGRLWRYDYHGETGDIANPVPLIDYTGEEGQFDGLCVDAEGMIWVAHWGGHKVSRWNPETAKKVAEIEVPALNVTSCCFGGERQDTLFITTAQCFDEAGKAAWPLGGALFTVKPGVKGKPADRFGK